MSDEAKVLAWTYDRVGSICNPHLILAGQQADDLRLGRPGILEPCSNHVNWRPLIGVTPSASIENIRGEARMQRQISRLQAQVKDLKASRDYFARIAKQYEKVESKPPKNTKGDDQVWFANTYGSK